MAILNLSTRRARTALVLSAIWLIAALAFAFDYAEHCYRTHCLLSYGRFAIAFLGVGLLPVVLLWGWIWIRTVPRQVAGGLPHTLQDHQIEEDDARREEVLKCKTHNGILELLPNGIRLGEVTHTYDSVAHIGRYARQTYGNFVLMEDVLRITIYLDQVASPIIVENILGIPFTTSKIKKVYERLVEKTSHSRTKRYLSQIERNGYFEYGGAKFFVDGRVQIKNKGINLSEVSLQLEPFSLVVKEPKFFARKLKISTEIDQDIFLPLLRTLYGVSFE